MESPHPPDSDWLKPPEEQAGLERYVETLRERFWLILVTVLITTGIAILYVASAPKTYEAEADLLITPADSGNPIYGSLGLIQGSSDPVRDVETASRLITNIDVARRVVEEQGLDVPPQSLLGSVEAKPVAQSSIVAITATGDSAAEAKARADGFAEGAVAYRTDQMHAQIDEQLPRLQAQAASGATTDGESTAQEQIDQLQLLRSGPDPTMRVETLAVEPTTAASPRPALSVAAGIFAGLILGIGAAFVSQVLDPRLRRESQLRRHYSLPILGRIPKEPRRSGDDPLDPRAISPVAAEAYRTLRSTLLANRPADRDGADVIFITGSAPSEGKTTTTINLATSIAVSGKRVIVIESDLRRPVIGKSMGVASPAGGVVSVLLENTSLEESLVQADAYGPSLKLLLADYEGGWISELFSIPSAAEMVATARRIADVVIIDSPPINEVVDALPLAQLADQVLLITRLGVTRLDRLSRLGELLAENEIRPVGFAVIGVPRPKRSEYHYYAGNRGMEQRRLRLPKATRNPSDRAASARQAPVAEAPPTEAHYAPAQAEPQAYYPPPAAQPEPQAYYAPPEAQPEPQAYYTAPGSEPTPQAEPQYAQPAAEPAPQDQYVPQPPPAEPQYAQPAPQPNGQPPLQQAPQEPAPAQPPSATEVAWSAPHTAPRRTAPPRRPD